MQTPIPATYMRGGTSKGTFFKLSDLLTSYQVARQAQDAFLLRVVGGSDPYGKQIDELEVAHFSKFSDYLKTYF